MQLRDLLGRIGDTYDRSLGQAGEAQQLLRVAPEVVADHLSARLIVDASGGKGNAATVPWIAVFNPVETKTARHGMYVVYLFDADMKTVALSLNQGVTELVESFGAAEGRRKLAAQAAAIRSGLPTEFCDEFEDRIDLRSRADLPRSYEFGNILARTYDLRDLPDDSQLVADLQRFVDIYDLALELRDALRISKSDAIATTRPVDPPRNEPEFKPKDDSEYLQQIAARTIRKRRDHETVITRYSTFLKSRKFAPSNTNVHPRDLTATREGEHWLIEVKVVYRRNGVEATRAALSQLLMYRDFHYKDDEPVRMLAVFSESVGGHCVKFLERHGIASVWKDGPNWAGSPTAVAAGLSEAPG